MREYMLQREQWVASPLRQTFPFFAQEVCYVLPMALIAPVRGPVHTLCVRPSLEWIFDYRELVFNRLFNGLPETGRHASRELAAKEENAA